MKMRLFIVTSVYQFMNALTVQMNDPTVSSDILCATKLLDETFDLEKLKEEKLFEDVYCWTGKIDGFKTVSKTKADKIKNAFKKVGLAMNKRKLLSDFPIIDRQCVIAELLLRVFGNDKRYRTGTFHSRTYAELQLFLSAVKARAYLRHARRQT